MTDLRNAFRAVGLIWKIRQNRSKPDEKMDTGGFVGPQASKSKNIPITGFRANGLFFVTLFSLFF